MAQMASSDNDNHPSSLALSAPTPHAIAALAAPNDQQIAKKQNKFQQHADRQKVNQQIIWKQPSKKTQLIASQEVDLNGHYLTVENQKKYRDSKISLDMSKIEIEDKQKDKEDVRFTVEDNTSSAWKNVGDNLEPSIFDLFVTQKILNLIFDFLSNLSLLI